MPTIPAYTINGFTRPELHLDSSGNIVLDPVATQFAATYGLRALYLGVPSSTPYPPVPASLTTPADANGSANSVAEGAVAGTAVDHGIGNYDHRPAGDLYADRGQLPRRLCDQSHNRRRYR